MVDSITFNSASQVQSFARSTTDASAESIAAARFIGYARKNETRLNIFSALTTGDKLTISAFRFWKADGHS